MGPRRSTMGFEMMSLSRHMHGIVCLACGMMVSSFLCGENRFSGTVENPEAGVRFTIPEGWEGELSGDVLIMRSSDVSFTLLLIEHQHSDLDGLRHELEKGVNQDGFCLELMGMVSPYGAGGLSAQYQGSVRSRETSAYLVSLLHPYGRGLSIMGIGDAGEMNREWIELVNDFADSFEFTDPDQADVGHS